MGNQTNAGLWVAQERLRAIERAAYWRGWVKRKDLAALFGVSLAQASSDLQKYQELNPGALQYNMNAKRYEGAREMVCVLVKEPSLEEAMGAFLGEEWMEGEISKADAHSARRPVGEGILCQGGGRRQWWNERCSLRSIKERDCVCTIGPSIVARRSGAG